MLTFIDIASTFISFSRYLTLTALTCLSVMTVSQSYIRLCSFTQRNSNDDSINNLSSLVAKAKRDRHKGLALLLFILLVAAFIAVFFIDIQTNAIFTIRWFSYFVSRR